MLKFNPVQPVQVPTPKKPQVRVSCKTQFNRIRPIVALEPWVACLKGIEYLMCHDYDVIACSSIDADMLRHLKLGDVSLHSL